MKRLAFAIMILTFASPLMAAIVRVQSTSAGNIGATTVALTLSGAPANGNTLVLVVGSQINSANPVTSITQTGATWQRAITRTRASGSNEIWYAQNVSSAGTGITVNLSTSAKASAIVAEYSGLVTSGALDQIATNIGFSTTGTVTGTAATCTANEVWIGGYKAEDGTNTFSSPTQSFSIIAQAASTGGAAATNENTVMLEKIVSATGTPQTGITMALTKDWLGTIATFADTTCPKTLTVTKAGNGTGTVTSSPAGISCGGDCSEVYAVDTAVTLTATADAGSVLTSWTGNNADCNSGTTTSAVTMSVSMTCTANFSLLTTGTTYHVRTDGDDTACTGAFDANTAVAPNCAFLTVNKALNTIANGDDINIHAGTFTGQSIRTAALDAAITNRTIIQADPNVASPTTNVILNGGGAVSVMTFNSDFRFVTIQNLRFVNATRGLLEVGNGSSTFGDIKNVITGNYFDDNPGTLCCVSTAGGASTSTGWALQLGVIRQSEISNNTFEGDPAGAPLFGVNGSHAAVMLFFNNSDPGLGNGNTVKNNTGSNWLGWLIGQGQPRMIIQDNNFTDLAGIGDDSAIQDYNDDGMIIRGNRFLRVCPSNPSYGTFLNIRSTPNVQASGGNCGSESAWTEFVNNTISLHPNCAALGNENTIYRRNQNQCEGGTAQRVVYINNLAIGAFGSGARSQGAVSYNDLCGQCTPATSLNLCPSLPVQIHHNAWDQANTSRYAIGTTVRSGCTWLPTGDPNVDIGLGDIQADPNVDANMAPGASSPLCGAGYSSYTMSDGVAAKTWIGALQGACGAAPMCGNNAKEAGEVCDGSDLGGATCVSQGFCSGALACNGSCSAFVTTGCVACPSCGNGIKEGSEACDGTDFGSDTCSLHSCTGGSLTCTGSCTVTTGSCTGCQTCGNGTKEGTEQCDTTDFGSATCVSRGFCSGALTCSASCVISDSGCVACPTCGDGTRNAGEQCDTFDTGGQSCLTLGFCGGSLLCSPTCTLTTEECTPCDTCGNGVKGAGEDCDGADLASQTCLTRGYCSGTLSCAANCTFNTSACGACSLCGNGVRAGAEQCDGLDLDGQTCIDRGFCGGILTCTQGCLFNTTACTACSTCGNGTIETGEQCDGAALGGATCGSLGLCEGTLSCSAGCAYNTSLCGSCSVCGNSVKETGEECDGIDFGADTCALHGYDGGRLICSETCKVQTESCRCD